MPEKAPQGESTEAFRQLVRRAISSGKPQSDFFDACRAVLQSPEDRGPRLKALCALLEGRLADPELPIGDTAVLVRLLKALARGSITPEELL